MPTPTHPSENVDRTYLPDGSFEYLQEGQPVTISRERAFEMRDEGLALFREYFEGFNAELVKLGAPPGILAWAYKVLLEAAPLYFWVIPSSSSGKYHPEVSQGEQGLVVHTLAGMYYTKEIARTYNLSPVATALAIAAYAIHDMCKYGIAYDVRYFSVHENLVRVKLSYKETGLDKDITKEYFDQIIRAVEHHNGSMTSGEWTSFRQPPPDDICRTVHMADYVVSRKKIPIRGVDDGRTNLSRPHE